MTISEQIKYHRKRKGLTQKELAYKVGVTQDCISKLESEDEINNTIGLLQEILLHLDGGIFLKFVEDDTIKKSISFDLEV